MSKSRGCRSQPRRGRRCSTRSPAPWPAARAGPLRRRSRSRSKADVQAGHRGERVEEEGGAAGERKSGLLADRVNDPCVSEPRRCDRNGRVDRDRDQPGAEDGVAKRPVDAWRSPVQPLIERTASRRWTQPSWESVIGIEHGGSKTMNTHRTGQSVIHGGISASWLRSRRRSGSVAEKCGQCSGLPLCYVGGPLACQRIPCCERN